MRLEELKHRYELRNLPVADYEIAAATLTAFDAFARGEGTDADGASVPALDRFLSTLVASGENSAAAVYGLARYYYVIGRSDLYIRLTQYTGGVGVIETIIDRLERVSGHEAKKRVEAGLTIPPLGTPPEAMPVFTAAFMAALRRELSGAKLERVLSGNNHGIPDLAFDREKEAYAAAPTFEDYLRDYHVRQVEELRGHAKSGIPWFEQHITDEVVDFVASQPEIQGGVLRDGKVYETKIPYDIERWLHAETPEEKRYYACHCPFARESVKAGERVVDPLWCHCSGGFVKRRYEVLFGRELRARCLRNALAGDTLCRFEIDLSDVPYKR
ncbi:MAG: hypothetical protein WC509_03795 [Candidatus Izemoplasmatales bacterium]